MGNVNLSETLASLTTPGLRLNCVCVCVFTFTVSICVPLREKQARKKRRAFQEWGGGRDRGPERHFERGGKKNKRKGGRKLDRRPSWHPCVINITFGLRLHNTYIWLNNNPKVSQCLRNQIWIDQKRCCVICRGIRGHCLVTQMQNRNFKQMQLMCFVRVLLILNWGGWYE